MNAKRCLLPVKTSLLALTFLIAPLGCEKVPTFQELTGQQQNSSTTNPPAAAPATTAPASQPPIKTETPKATVVDPQKAIAEFQNKSPRTITDEDLKLLASLPTGLEQIRSVDVTLGGISDEGLQNFAKFPAITDLNLTSTNIDGHGLAFLKNCPTLKKLTVGATLRMTPQGWEALSTVTQLESLDVSGNGNLSNADVGKFVAMTNLLELNLSRTPVTDDVFEHLAAMENLAVLRLENIGSIDGRGLQAYTKSKPNLRELHSTGTQLGRAGLRHLKSIPSIEYLDISSTGLTDQQFAEFKGAGNIAHLRVGRNGLSALGMQTVLTLKKLKTLDLEGMPSINDPALGVLVKMKGLQKLVLKGTSCSRRAVDEFQRLNKNCEVIDEQRQ